MVVASWYLHGMGTILMWKLQRESKNRKSTTRTGLKVPMLFFPVLVSTAVAASWHGHVSRATSGRVLGTPLGGDYAEKQARVRVMIRSLHTSQVCRIEPEKPGSLSRFWYFHFWPLLETGSSGEKKTPNPTLSTIFQNLRRNPIWVQG